MLLVGMILIILGIIIFIASFLIPEMMSNHEEDIKVRQEDVEKAVSNEMKNMKGKIEGTVNEAVEYAMEKTERSLSKLSNEKIMAVNEYSDTVLKEINKSHEEVMFLYDMLNSKHANLQNTAMEIERRAKEAEETAKTAKETVEVVEETLSSVKEEVIKNSIEAETKGFLAGIGEPIEDSEMERVLEQQIVEMPADAKEETIETEEIREDLENRNYNDTILKLHQEGKSQLQIAKELGLGIGEVKLVINLFEGVGG